MPQPTPLTPTTPQPACGFEVQHHHPQGPKFTHRAAAAQIAHWLQAHGVDMVWLDIQPTPSGWQFRLTADAWLSLTPGFDTLGLVERLGTQRWSMELEIAVAMLASPVLHVFPSFDELCAHVDVRKNIGQAGKLTTLAFATETAERPDRYWTYAEDTGFTLKPGASLIDALTMATQPSVSGELFSFSCYRATEYVLLLGMAHTLQAFHPKLLQQLEDQWRHKAIASGRFHDTFLNEVGSLEHPLPHRFYVPGDRVWFRNPDEASADVVGFEGSWVIYLGQGRFTDFWRPQSTYTLESKCLEIFYWRDAVVLQPNGEPMIDETVVWARIAALDDTTPQGREEKERIMTRMMRYRDGRGIYAEGGCIDATREHPRMLCPHTTTVSFCSESAPKPDTVPDIRPASTLPA